MVISIPKNIPNKNPIVCFKKSTLIRSGVLFILGCILVIYLYHKYQKSKCENFCIYDENFSNIIKKKREERYQSDHSHQQHKQQHT
jgi:hypothetical protein